MPHHPNTISGKTQYNIYVQVCLGVKASPVKDELGLKHMSLKRYIPGLLTYVQIDRSYHDRTNNSIKTWID